MGHNGDPGLEGLPGLSSGHPGLDGLFGGFDAKAPGGRAGQSYPGSFEELNEAIEEYARGIPGSTIKTQPDGSKNIELPDGTTISTYPVRKSTKKPGFSVSKPGQKERNGIKGSIEGGLTRPESDEGGDRSEGGKGPGCAD